MPVFMNDNYFSLLPGESKEIIMEFDKALLGNDEAKIIIEQYNTEHENQH